MTKAFWLNSNIVKPNGTEFVCHASASDFFNAFDFRFFLSDTFRAKLKLDFFVSYRIKMCTEVNEEYLETVFFILFEVAFY
jgi:hypothetical protein